MMAVWLTTSLVETHGEYRFRRGNFVVTVSSRPSRRVYPAGWLAGRRQPGN